MIDPQDELICLGHDEDLAARGGAIMPTIVQTSLFARKSFAELIEGLGAEHRNCVYTRGRNPTVMALEQKLAMLERGEAAKCFGSGMGAVSAVLLGLLRQGDHVLFANHVYGPALQLAQHLNRFGIAHSHRPTCDLGELERALLPNTRMIYFESPGTMLFRQLDIAGLVALAKTHGATTVIDNTWATPLFQKPLTLGVDFAIHSCTKYIGGHSDVVGGVVIGSAELLERIFYNAFLLNGAAPAPVDAFLLVRGLRTLPVRLRQHQADGLRVARFLAEHPAVARVFHPSLIAEDQGYCGSQLQGTTGLFSFALHDERFDVISKLLDGLRLFRIGVSWGGVESLVIAPHRGHNLEAMRQAGLPPGLVRLSVGLEGAELLIEDLDRALLHSGAQHG